MNHPYLADNVAFAGFTPRDCAYCGCGEAETVDHIIPRAKGGTNRRENRVPACGPCNAAKGSRILRGVYMRVDESEAGPVHVNWARARQHVRDLRAQLWGWTG